jgi:hypothetical protein
MRAVKVVLFSNVQASTVAMVDGAMINLIIYYCSPG